MATLQERRGTDVNLRSGPQRREYLAIADRIAADAPGRVLDWGCGWGQMTELLKGRGLEVEAFDFRPEAPVEGRQPLERFPAIEAYLSHDPVTLPYADASFDAVLSCGVLEHVGDPDASLDELHRILRPGGTLYVYKLPNRFSYLEWVARRIGTIYWHGKLPDDRLYDKRIATGIARRHGFTVREFKRTNLLPLTIDHPVVARMSGPIWAVNRGLRYVPGLSLLATNVELVLER